MQRLSAALCAAALFALLAGCGSDERTFTAEDLVAELEENGVALNLGETLTTDQEGVELYAVRLEREGSGTLAITDDADAALTEYERCESSAALFCFRAANAVLVFDSEVPNQDLARVATAVEALAED